MYIMLLILTKFYGTNKCLYVKTLLYTSLYPDYTRDALAPYLLHSQVPLTEESTALIRSKCIPGVTETGHNTIKKIKELSTQNDANERKNHGKRVEEIYFPYICAVTETSN